MNNDFKMKKKTTEKSVNASRDKIIFVSKNSRKSNQPKQLHDDVYAVLKGKSTIEIIMIISFKKWQSLNIIFYNIQNC